MVTALTALLLFAANGFDAIEKQIAAGNYQAALAALETSPPADRKVQWHLLASQCHDGLKDPAGAVQEAQTAVELNPRSEQARLQLAQIFLTWNTPEPAYEILRDALPVFPQSALIRLGLGLALNGLERYSEAIPILKDCLRMRPDLGLAFDALGNAYLDSSNFDGLLQEAAEYTQRNPGDFRGYYYQAAARQKFGHITPETEALVRRSLELNPQFAAAHVLLGRLLLATDRTEAAVTALAEAVRLRPKYVTAHLYLGMAYRRMGREEEAQRESEEVAAINKEQNDPRPQLMYHRGAADQK